MGRTRKRRPTPYRQPRAAASTSPTAASTVPAPFGATSLGMARTVAGGRLSLDTEQTYLGAMRVILPPPSADDTWRTLSLDDDTLTHMSPARLLELLCDLSPDVSRALFDFLRLTNPGYEVVCLRPGTEEPDEQAKAVLDTFLDHLHDIYGSIDILLGRLFIGAFLRGAFFAELVLDEAGRMPVDLATPDPSTARFQRFADPVRGTVWQLGQWQVSGFVPLDRPTIRYLPVDPFPGSPYGRAMAAPALFTALFLLGLLHDLRRVVSQQGYPRIDISINSERLAASMPEPDRDDPEKFMQWANAALAEVKEQYARLQPDDAYAHLDVVEIQKNVGTVDAHSLGAVDPLISVLERMLTRALKTMPLLMALETGSTEAASNRQWEVMAAGVKSIQHLAETMLSRLMGLALQVQGVVTTVEWRFAELRASEEQRDATTLGLKIANARQLYDAGFIGMDEAAQMVVGHPADAKEPRILERGENVDGTTAAKQADVADPGSKRSTPLRVVGGE